jgi:hypothetical protein
LTTAIGTESADLSGLFNSDSGEKELSSREERISGLMESDRNREEFLSTMAGIDWTDARNYHLCLNMGIISLSDAEEMIIRLVERRRGGSAVSR